MSNTGTWIQRVAQDWLVLDLTHSAQALGIVTSLQFGPAILFSLHGGSLADRFDKRRWVIWTNAVAALCAFAMGILVQTGDITIHLVYIIAIVLGVASAVQAPIWQTLVHDLVGRADLSNAIALNSTNFNIGRLIGPALSGYLISLFGTGPSFLINGVTYSASIYALATMRTSEFYDDSSEARSQVKTGVRAGLSYLRTRRDIVVVLVLIGCAGTFGLNYQMYMALMSRNVFDIQADSFGLLGSCMAAGSVTGALFVARRKTAPTAAFVRLLVLTFGSITALASLAPTYLTYALALPFCGFAALTMLSSANAYVQGTTDPAYRGRVMGVYMLVFIGGTPIGSMSLGWVAENIGVRVAIFGCGVIVAAVAAMTLLVPLARITPEAPGIEEDTTLESPRS
jgi:MFS family permease